MLTLLLFLLSLVNIEVATLWPSSYAWLNWLLGGMLAATTFFHQASEEKNNG
jgi:hypothetical protein